ncbi:MAG TPA: DUF1559 domain-containing protein [Gemmataceae bacterium]|nr:DUF1559 domain-containing protein [Gemmataceae bacterium]
MNANEMPVDLRRRVHPMAKWSLGVAAATVPACLLAGELMPLPALIGGGLATLLGICGCLSAQQPSGRYRGYVWSGVGIVVGLLTIGLAVDYSSMAKVRPSATRSQSKNNLKQLALAMHNYHDTLGHLPPAASKDSNGQPLLSWRVAILPFVEEEKLYKQFHLDEPWDSPNTVRLHYCCVDVRLQG